MASMAKPGPTVNFLAEIAWRFLDLRPTCLSFSYVTDAVCLYQPQTIVLPAILEKQRINV